jgi:hypothetical protein
VRDKSGQEWLCSFDTYERDSEVTPLVEHRITFDMICRRKRLVRISEVKADYISREEYERQQAINQQVRGNRTPDPHP